MTLSRRMGMQVGALIGCVIALGAVGLWGVAGQASNLSLALGEYRVMRDSYELASRVARARAAVQASTTKESVDLMRSAAFETASLAQRLRDEDRPAAGDAAARAADRLMEAAHALGNDTSDNEGGRQHALGVVNTALNEIAFMGESSRRRIDEIQDRATRQRAAALATAGALTLVVAATAGAVAWRQRRAVLAPLRQLRQAVQRVAAGRFQERVEVRSDDEFVELAGEFNHMAGELDTLYRGLEERVARAGKELARAERLASVGFLAAGVAHEINNPLAIVSGHAELALRSLDRAQTGDAAAHQDAARQAREALEVVRDEAFRCKEITGRLLSLARPGDGRRVPMSVEPIARQVVSLTAGLPRHQGKRVTLTIDPAANDAGIAITASPDEMRQVLLNLVLNALEAVKPGEGVVEVRARRVGAMVEIEVSDNGAGMSAQTLSRIFEPFYSERGGEGLGLGLSIVQAIISEHGGRIRAASAGPGLGSVFTMEIPGVPGVPGVSGAGS